MTAVDDFGGVIKLLIYAFIAYNLVIAFSDVTPGFGPIGGKIFWAFIAAILVYVKSISSGD